MLANCKYCNLELDHKRLPRHEKACRLNPVNSIAAVLDPVELTKENITLIENLPKQLKRNRSICYTCRSCQQKVIINSYLKFRSFDTCPQCDRVKTCIQRYGGKAPACSQEVSNRIVATRKLSGEEGLKKSNEKRKKTCLQKYGVEVVSQNKDIRAKQISTFKNKTAEEKREIQVKRRKTLQELYGDNYREVLKEKREATSFNRFGFRNIFCTEGFQEKKKQASLKKYGTEHPSQSPLVRSKVKATNVQRYGTEHFVNPEKAKQTCIDKYGIPHYPKGVYDYDGLHFDSKWELALWIYAKDHDEEIEREPTYFTIPFKGKNCGYTLDFRYKGKLIEVKGDQFFKADGTLQNPFDHSQDERYEYCHQYAIQHGIEFWRYEDVKFAIDYVNQKYTKDYLGLFKRNIPFPYPELNYKKDDLNLIRFFHKSLYEASRKGTLSPLEAWQDKNLVKKSALNRLKYTGSCTTGDIIKGFSVARIAPKVSTFKPTRAQKLISSYLDEAETIVDPFSGFSGRLLGTFRLGKAYKGFDISEKHVKESNEIIEYLHILNATISVEDLLKAPIKVFDEKVCLFTCPPYGGKEHWNEKNDEIEKTCDEWIDICLEKYKGCKKYLFVVDETEKYKDKVVEEIINKSHFGENREKVVLIEG